MARQTHRSIPEAGATLLRLRDESGVILAVTLLVMVVLSALGASILSLSAAEFGSTRLAEHRVQAFNLAEAAQAYARRALTLDLDLDGNGIKDQAQVFINNQPLVWNSTPLLAGMQAGARGAVTISRHTIDPDLAVITSTATFGMATKTIEPTVRRPATLATSAKAALAANGPIATNGTIKIDGRDHDINGNLILSNGTKGVFSASSYGQGGASKVGGTDATGYDHPVKKPGDPSIIDTYGSWDDPATWQVETMPTTPDAVMGYSLGTLKGLALSGVNGSQYVTDPTTLTFPLSGITYVELPLGGIWRDIDFGASSGILVVHNANRSAIFKNLNYGTFTGLIIADDILHIHATIIGAVVSLTEFPSAGNVIGNGSGEVLFSRPSGSGRPSRGASYNRPHAGEARSVGRPGAGRCLQEDLQGLAHLPHIDGVVGERNLDPLGIEGLLQPATVLAPHVPLLNRLGLKPGLDDDGGVRKIVDAENLNRFQDAVSPVWILPHLLRHPPHDLRHAVGVLLIGYPHIDHVARPHLGHVGEGIDRSIGKDVDDPGEIPEDDGAKRDRLHEATRPVDDGHVANPDLVLQHHKEAADKITDEILRPKADGQADYAGPGQDRRHIESHLAEGDDHDQSPYEDEGDGLEKTGEGRDPLLRRSRHGFGLLGMIDEYRLQSTQAPSHKSSCHIPQEGDHGDTK
jgi:hypothetical protein